MTEAEAQAAPSSVATDDVAPTRGKTAGDALEAWMQTHVHNTVISQDTTKFNRVRALVDELKRTVEDTL